MRPGIKLWCQVLALSHQMTLPLKAPAGTTALAPPAVESESCRLAGSLRHVQPNIRREWMYREKTAPDTRSNQPPSCIVLGASITVATHLPPPVSSRHSHCHRQRGPPLSQRWVRSKPPHGVVAQAVLNSSSDRDPAVPQSSSLPLWIIGIVESYGLR